MNQSDLMEQAKVEARAKIIWGDPPKQVILFLRTRGLSLAEAIEITDAAYAERVAELRAKGINQIIGGVCLLGVPWIGYVIASVFGSLSFLGMVVFGLSCAVGLYGLYLIITGGYTLLFPQAQDADADEE